MVTKRYLIEKGNDQINLALPAILQLCQKLPTNDVTLVVSKKQGWKFTVFGERFSPSDANTLLKGLHIRLANGVTIKLESTQIFNSATSLDHS